MKVRALMNVRLNLTVERFGAIARRGYRTQPFDALTLAQGGPRAEGR